MGVAENSKSSDRINKRDILLQFGERVLMDEKKEKPDSINLNLAPDLTTQFLVPYDLVAQYRAIDFDDGLEGEHKNVRLKPISVQQLSQDPSKPVSLVIMKRMDMEEGNKFYHRFKIRLLHGDLTRTNDEAIVAQLNAQEGNIANFLFQERDDHFDFHHRIVKPEYRGRQNESGEHVSSILLTATEQAAQQFVNANPSVDSKPIELDPGQLDVMIWLNNHGYKPATTEDQNKFDQVLNGDSNLYVTDDFWIRQGSDADSTIFRIRFSKNILKEHHIEPAIDPKAQAEEMDVRKLDDAEIQRIQKELGQ